MTRAQAGSNLRHIKALIAIFLVLGNSLFVAVGQPATRPAALGEDLTALAAESLVRSETSYVGDLLIGQSSVVAKASQPLCKLANGPEQPSRIVVELGQTPGIAEQGCANQEREAFHPFLEWLSTTGQAGAQP